MSAAAHIARRRRILVPVAAWITLLALGIDLLAPHRTTLDPGTVALLLLPAPLAAGFAGRIAAIVAASVSALAFNYWFTEPYDSLRIESSTSVIAFVAYGVLALGVAVVFDELLDRRRTSEARMRDAILLRDLTLDLATQHDHLEPPMRSALADLRRAMQLDGALVDVRVGDDHLHVADGDGDGLGDATPTGGAPAAGEVRSLRPSPGVEVVPIRAGDDTIGALVVRRAAPIDTSERRLLDAFANVLAIAVQRARLASAAIERQALEETDRLRVALLQSVTHDLRTPLTAIKALAGALLESEVPESHAAVLRDIESESDRLARLVNGLLDLSRIEGGALQVDRQRVEVDELVHRVAAAPSFAAAQPPIEVTVAPDLPAVLGDELLLHQALSNLVDNAVRHGGAPIEVDARPDRDGHGVAIVVRDHGPGIAPPERERLFVADPRRRPDRPMGIGLQVARGFVEANGGTIHVAPTPGGGATFTVRLPADRGGSDR